MWNATDLMNPGDLKSGSVTKLRWLCFGWRDDHDSVINHEGKEVVICGCRSSGGIQCEHREVIIMFTKRCNPV